MNVQLVQRVQHDPNEKHILMFSNNYNMKNLHQISESLVIGKTNFNENPIEKQQMCLKPSLFSNLLTSSDTNYIFS